MMITRYSSWRRSARAAPCHVRRFAPLSPSHSLLPSLEQAPHLHSGQPPRPCLAPRPSPLVSIISFATTLRSPPGSPFRSSRPS